LDYIYEERKATKKPQFDDIITIPSIVASWSLLLNFHNFKPLLFLKTLVSLKKHPSVTCIPN
jgi:hypothetical protein